MIKKTIEISGVCKCPWEHGWSSLDFHGHFTHTKGNVFFPWTLIQWTRDVFLVDLHNMDKFYWNGKCVEVTTTATIVKQLGWWWRWKVISWWSNRIACIWHRKSSSTTWWVAWQLKNKPRDWQQGHEWIYYVYFTPSLMFDEILFKRMYRMTRNLFLHIMSLFLWVWCFFCAMPKLYKEA